MTTIDPDSIGADPADADLLRLAEMARAEAEALAELLPAALEYQWRRPASGRADTDTSERASGVYSDPTPDVALDGRRLRLRAQVLQSERILRETVIRARGIRRGLERAIEAYDAK